jgi:hypothetical protein
MPHATGASRQRARSRRLLQTADENPLDGVANLFDTTIVLSVALILALLARPMLPKNFDGSKPAAALEIVDAERQKLERFRLSDQTIGGDGQRLGVAYRLESGEVICVTEQSDAE